ncbi:MAG: methyl-accepting chemotaxis protein, partial [Pseudomonadales bacterium]|nr:methyl-accepting chemotaxis protein [Pseudomonadales bacterium]
MLISQKLPTLLVGFSVSACIITAIAAYLIAAAELTTSAHTKLSALGEARKSTLSGYLRSVEEDLSVIADSEMARSALAEFSPGFNDFGNRATTTLQNLYITNNTHPLGEKHKLNLARDGSIYSQAHGRYHPWFRKLLETRGYYDIFLINTKGDVVYSVFKENDYATNLDNGQWKDSDLGHVYRKVNSNPRAGYIAFTDFSPYAPSNDAPASFIATPVMGSGRQQMGTLVFQMPIARINEVMQAAEGMGESGETYLVGSDFLMRSDSRFSEESTILKTKVESETVKAAIAGESGVQQTMDYRGISVESAFTPLKFQGVTWALIAEVDTDEALAGVATLRNIAALIGCIVAVLVGLAGVFVSRRLITQPIGLMVNAMAQLAGGDKSTTIPCTEQDDELGDMANAVEVFKQSMIKAEQLAQDEEKSRNERNEQERQLAAERERLATDKANEQEQQRKEAENRSERMNTLTSEFDRLSGEVLGAVSSAAQQLDQTARSMSTLADENAHQATVVASASEETSINVQMIATASDQMANVITEIAQQISHSAQIANKAVTEAEFTSSTINSLAEAAQKVGAVVDLIKDIADQTNLLALNATIEAARA